MSYQVLSSLPLNTIEKYFCAHGGWVTIAHTAHLTGNYSKLIANATEAVQCILKRHPRMRTRIRVEDDDRYFMDNLEYNREHLSSDLFFSTVETTDESSWQEIVERQCNKDPYSNNATIIFPSFHFMLLFNPQQQSDDEIFHLILFTNHCVSDGRSGFILMNDFLTFATTPNLHESSEPLNTEILPLIGQLIARPYGPFFPVMSFVGRQVFKQEVRHMTHPRIPVKVTPLEDCYPTKWGIQRYKIKCLFASSSSNLFPKLHQQCRAQEITLNGPLFGCLLLAIHHYFPSGDNSRLKPFGIGTPFDMRSRLPQSPLTSSSVGFFVGLGEVKLKRSLPIQSTTFWTLARQCMTATQNQLKRDGIPLMMNIFADILGNRRHYQRFAQRFPEGRQSEFGFSNIGKYPFSCEYNQGEVKLRGIHVINNTSLYRNSSGFYATCANGDQLDFSLAHEMESDKKAKDFLDYYLRLIEICADGERCKTETTLEQLLNMVESPLTE